MRNMREEREREGNESDRVKRGGERVWRKGNDMVMDCFMIDISLTSLSLSFTQLCSFTSLSLSLSL